MGDIYYITYLSDEINEGGMARNLAFSNKVRNFEARRLNMYLYRNNIIKRTWKGINFLFFLLCKKSKTIIVHQSAITLLFPLLTKELSRKIFKLILKRISSKNKLIIEVNDLPYEQAIDLDLPVLESMLKLEDILYSIPNCHYIFASTEMSKYVIEKYRINHGHSKVVINGGPVLLRAKSFLESQNWINSDSTKYVYAGSLNKGRQIERIIEVFLKNPDSILVLIGIWGEWLNEIDLPQNIIYLGDFDEITAQTIVSVCDLGIIPYDEEKFYYNLCYPTKASFYITAGIPFLSTPLKELMNVFESEDMAFFEEFNNWKDFVRNFDKSILMRKRVKVKNGISKFYWDNLIDNCFYEILTESKNNLIIKN